MIGLNVTIMTPFLYEHDCGWTPSTLPSLIPFVLQAHLPRHTIPASRYVVANCFTILARMMGGMQSLEVPSLVKNKRDSEPPPYESRAAGLSSPRDSKVAEPGRIARWKDNLVAAQRRKDENVLKRELDQIAHDMEQGWHHLRTTKTREQSERW